MPEDTMRLQIPNHTDPNCAHCEDTHTCDECRGSGEIMRASGAMDDCETCSGFGHCTECCCIECEEYDQRPCAGHETEAA